MDGNKIGAQMEICATIMGACTQPSLTQTNKDDVILERGEGKGSSDGASKRR